MVSVYVCVFYNLPVCVDVICLCVAVKAGPLYLMAGASEITPLDSSYIDSHPVPCKWLWRPLLPGSFNVAVRKAAQTQLH